MTKRLAVASAAVMAAAAALAVAPGAAWAAVGGDAAAGKTAFASRCGSCHSAGPGVGEAAQGPPLAGVVGRKAGTVKDFDYSAALKAAAPVWTAPNLDRWLAGPSKMVPGTTMPILVGDAKARANIIAYLATTKAAPTGK